MKTQPVKSPQIAWGPSPALAGPVNMAAPSHRRQIVQAEHGMPEGGTRIDARNASALYANPVLTPVQTQPNVIPTPDFDDDDDVEAGRQPNEVPESDSESHSVLPPTAESPPLHQPAAGPVQPPVAPAPEGLRRIAMKTVMGSIPVVAGIALMIEGRNEENDAMLVGGAALVGGTGAYLAGVVIDKLVDCVTAWCGGGAAAQ